MGHLNVETDCAAMHSYFEKFGALKRCYRTTEKETNKNQEYDFMVFKTAATADEVQQARPHTLRGREVSTRRVVPRERKSNPEANTRDKKLYIESIHGHQVGRIGDISDADIEEYFSRYSRVVRVSQA